MVELESVGVHLRVLLSNESWYSNSQSLGHKSNPITLDQAPAFECYHHISLLCQYK